MDETGSVLCPMESLGIKSVESIGSDITVLERRQTVISQCWRDAKQSY